MNPRFFRNGIVMLLLVVVALAVVITVLNQTSPNQTVAYSQFLSNVQSGNVRHVVQQGSNLAVTGADGKQYTVVIPGLLANQVLPDMQAAAEQGKVTLPADILEAKDTPDNGWISILITGLLPILIIGGFIFFMMRQAQGTNNQALSFG
ncbi:MAG TPA: ATP-dependent metallopeptidase FtsH/Yme1/Tma family protein, partial [Candidatus Limnocylindrales bacterium]|nr:ATP-dependent metallopeptidase FtsH/Yme1/Tma family protein [Candidatus Limnocylindrales bacterium]